MSRICQVTGKSTMSGNNVSHARNKNKRVFLPNLCKKRFWLPSEKRWVTLRVSARGIRTIDKNGVETVIGGLRRQGLRV